MYKKFINKIIEKLGLCNPNDAFKEEIGKFLTLRLNSQTLIEKEGMKMDKTIKETLQKQLQLLSERSEHRDSELPELTHAMIEIAELLSSFPR